MTARTNEYYLEGIRTRNRNVVQEIYRDFFPGVQHFVVRNSGEIHDARDVFNTVIYQLTARLEHSQINVHSTFEGYLFTACKNMWRRQLKKNERERVTKDNVRELYYEEQDMAQATLEQEKWELFHEKLREISENCREILQMFFNRMSSRAIMEAMDYASETTVRQRVFKCKTKLISLVKNDRRYEELKDQ